MKYLKNIATIFVGAMCILSATTAQASNTSARYVDSVLPTSTGYVFFTLKADPQGPGRSTIPSCGAGWPTRFAFNMTATGGQALLSTLLTAAAAGKPVIVWGTGACDAGLAAGDTEGVFYIELRP